MDSPNLSPMPEDDTVFKDEIEEVTKRCQLPVVVISDPVAVQADLAEINASLTASQVDAQVANLLYDNDIIDPSLLTNDVPAEAQQALQQVQSAVRNSSSEERTCNMTRWNALVAGIGIFTTALGTAYGVYAAMRQNSNGGPTQPSSVDVTTIRKLVAAWTDLTDEQFWQALASYVAATSGTKTGLSLGDQSQFMSYVIDLWPLSTPFQWTGADLVGVRDALLAACAAADGDTSALYTAAATCTWQGAPLPRPVMATVLRYALAKLAAGGPS